MLKVLIGYKSTHGDCDVPRYDKNYLQLAVWVVSQRKRRQLGELKLEQIAKLDRVGFVWEVVTLPTT